MTGRNIATPPAWPSAPLALVVLAPVVVAIIAGCVSPEAPVARSIDVEGTSFLIHQELEVGPGSGAWAGRVESMAPEVEIYFSLDGALRTEALDGLFVMVLDGSTVRAAGDLFYDRPAPRPDGDHSVVAYTLQGVLPLREGGRTVIVAWAGLEEAAAVRIGLPDGASLVSLGRTARATLLAPWTMENDGNPIVHQASSEHMGAGAVLFWGDVSLSRLGHAELSVTAHGRTSTAAVAGELIPVVHRFAAVLEGDVRVDSSILGAGDDPGVYGFLVDLPSGISSRGGLEEPVCATCT